MTLEMQLAKLFFFKSKGPNRLLKVSSWVAIGGVALGVMALLVTLGIVSGFQKEYRRAILGFNSHVVVSSPEELSEIESYVEESKHYLPDGVTVTGWHPFIYREGLLISEGTLKGIVLKGIDFEKYPALSAAKMTLENEGKDASHAMSLVLGKKIYDELKVPHVKILFPKSLKADQVSAKDIQTFYKSGYFETGLYDFDAAFAWLSLKDAQTFFGIPGKVSGIEFWLSDPDQADHWADNLRRDWNRPVSIQSWRELNEEMFKALEVEKIIFGILMSLLIAVASLNVLSHVVMLTLDRRRDMAVLRTIGFSWKRLRRIFLWDGMLVGVLGTSAGLILGLGILEGIKSWRPFSLPSEVYFLDKVPVSLEWTHVLIVVSVSLTLVFLGTALSLMGLSRMNLLKAISD